jgi:hypothetical protein
VDRELDRLYGLPLGEFTKERNELAKRLRAQGAPDAAETVRKLKKPTLPAWAVNQLTRRHRRQVRRLLEAGAGLREAHERLLAGGERRSLSEAAERERKVVGELVERAEPLLSEAGSPSAATLERVRSTLHAAALDEELRSELEAGRVVRDREPVGLGPFAPAQPGKRPARSTRDQRAERTPALKEELRQAGKRSEQAEKRLRAAERSLERAREEAEDAHRALLRREQEAEAARAEAEEAAAALERARDALEPG